MYTIRCLRTRKHLNAISRLAVTRPYTIEAQKTAHTPEEQAHFLRAQDQAALRETQEHLDKLISHIGKFQSYIVALPAAIQVPTTVKTIKRNGAQKPEVSYQAASVPYTTGFLRQRVREVPNVAQAIITKAEHVKEHLTDLQHEPYPEDGQSGMAEWQAEIAKMSKEEKEDRLKTMQYEEEAASARLKGDSNRLVRTVQQIEAMARKSGSVDLDAPEKGSNPFQKAEDSAKKKEPITVTTSKVGDEKTKGAEPAAAPAKPQLNILDLQKKLEESMRQRKS